MFPLVIQDKVDGLTIADECEETWTDSTTLKTALVRVDQIKLGQVKLGQVRLDQIRLDQIRLGLNKLGQVRLRYSPPEVWVF